jgi:hypothetical protein
MKYGWRHARDSAMIHPRAGQYVLDLLRIPSLTASEIVCRSGSRDASLGKAGSWASWASGDGMLAVFDGPATTLRCAAAVRSSAAAHDLRIRVGVHVGEVDVVGGSV